MTVCHVFQLPITLSTSWAQNCTNFHDSKLDSQETVNQRIEMKRFNQNASCATLQITYITFKMWRETTRSSFSRPKHTRWAHNGQTWLFVSITFVFCRWTKARIKKFDVRWTQNAKVSLLIFVVLHFCLHKKVVHEFVMVNLWILF